MFVATTRDYLVLLQPLLSKHFAVRIYYLLFIFSWICILILYFKLWGHHFWSTSALTSLRQLWKWPYQQNPLLDKRGTADSCLCTSWTPSDAIQHPQIFDNHSYMYFNNVRFINRKCSMKVKLCLQNIGHYSLYITKSVFCRVFWTSELLPWPTCWQLEETKLKWYIYNTLVFYNIVLNLTPCLTGQPQCML